MIAAGCSKQEQIPERLLDKADSFIATFADAQTKNLCRWEPLSLRWSSGDKISIFTTKETNLKYTYNGTTGSTSAIFNKTSDGDATGTALTYNYAVYPYSESTTVAEEGKLNITQRGKTDLTITEHLGYRTIGRLCCTAGGENIILEWYKYITN